LARTWLHINNKLMFRVYDYTDATALFGEKFISVPPSERPQPPDDDDLLGGDDDDDGDGEAPRAIEVQGFEVHLNQAGRFIVDNDRVVTVEEYKEALSARLVAQAADLAAFRQAWVDPDRRRALLQALPANGQSALLVRELESMEAYDLFDVLAHLGYGLSPRTMPERAAAFTFKQATWLKTLPAPAAAVITALAGQFATGGTNELESQYIWRTAEVQKAGGLKALAGLGSPAELLRETKTRIFAA
jgi:type I restriction enzyme R subunit